MPSQSPPNISLANSILSPPGRSYPQLKLKCKNLLMEEWDEAAPDPARYPFRPSLKPHPFMGLDKFTAGRLHQMRSGKSYLRALPSWDSDVPTTCPSCLSAPRHSSTLSSAAQLRSPPGPATFRGSWTSPRMPQYGPLLPSWAPSPASPNPRLQPSPRACSHARHLLPPLLLPAPLM